MTAELRAAALALFDGYLRAGVPITPSLVEDFTRRLLARMIVARCARFGTFRSN